MTDSVDSRALITARSRPLRGSLCKHLVALAWKEWRDQRRMVIAGVSTVIVVPVMLIASGAVTGSSSTSVDILRITRFTLVALVSPLLAAALGTVAVASERRNSVFAFVLSPPLSRSRVWGVKLCVASLCYLAVMLTASLVVSTSDLLSGATPSSLVAGILSGEMPTDRLLPVYAVGAPILMLGMAMMFATYLSSVVAAAAATVASAGVLLVLVSIYWTRLDFVTALDVPTLALELAAGSAAALLISWRRFRRGDLPQLSARRGAGAGVVCCLVVALAVCLVGLPTLWAHTRLPLERAVFSQFELSPDGDSVLVGVWRDDFRLLQNWLVPLNGDPIVRLTRRTSGSARFTNNGDWIVYHSARGLAGMVALFADLRAVRPDGSDDHLLYESIAHAVTTHHRAAGRSNLYALSPAAERVAVINDSNPINERLQRIAIVNDWNSDNEQLEISSLRGGKPISHDVARPSTYAMPVAWTTNGQGVFLARNDWNSLTSSLELVDVVTGRRTTVSERDGRYGKPVVGDDVLGAGSSVLILPWAFQPRAWASLSTPSGDYQIDLVDLSDGRVQHVEGSLLAPDGSAAARAPVVVSATVLTPLVDGFAYLTAVGADRQQLRAWRSEDETITALGTFDGQGSLLTSSPDGRYIAAWVQDAARLDYGETLVFDRRSERGPDNRLQSLAFSNWIPVGWQDNEHLVLRDWEPGPSISRRFAVVEVVKGEAGELTILDPTGSQSRNRP